MEMTNSGIASPFGKERDSSIDIAKVLLIFLVVWGHAIQYLHGAEYNFWENPFFKFIYGFHMPLFALISGYLMHNSITRYTTSRLIQRKAKQLLIPTVGWAAVLTVVDIVINLLTHEQMTWSWALVRFLSRTVNNLWFLKGIFISCIIVIFVEKCLKGHWAVYVVISLLTLFLPNIFNFALYGFILPFYIIGFKLGEPANRWNTSQSKAKRFLIFFVSLSVYISMLFFFHKKHFIYSTGTSVIASGNGFATQLLIDIYRFIVAFIGCIMFLEVCALVKLKTKWLITIASKTMIIYIVTASIFTYVPQLMKKMSSIVVFNSIPAVIIDIVVLIPVSLLLVLLSLLTEIIIKKMKLGTILLGY